MSYQRKISRFLLPEFAIAITLAFLLLVSPAYAEGELPPPEPEPVATETQPADPLPAEEPVLSDPVLTEPALAEPVLTETDPTVVEETITDPAVLEEPVLEPAAETLPAAEPVAEVLAEEPAVAEVAAALDEEDLSLVNEAGEVLSLASQETAEVISSADPYFTVGLVTYRFFAAGGMCGIYPPGTCFDGLAQPITSAITYIQVNGTIPNRWQDLCGRRILWLSDHRWFASKPEHSERA